MAQQKTAPSAPKSSKVDLRKTTIPRQADQPSKSTTFPPGVIILAAEQRKKHVAYAVAIFSLALSAFLLVWMASIQSREPKIMVLDRGSTVHIGPLEQMSGKSEVFRDVALWATQVALQRAPHGFNLPEFVPMFFRPKAVEMLNADLKSQLPDIQAKNLRQYPEVKSYEYLDQQDKQADGQTIRFLRVSGNIIRTGYYQGLPIAESVPFVVTFAAVPNPSLTEQDKYPYMIEDFRIDLNPRKKATQ